MAGGQLEPLWKHVNGVHGGENDVAIKPKVERQVKEGKLDTVVSKSVRQRNGAFSIRMDS